MHFKYLVPKHSLLSFYLSKLLILDTLASMFTPSRSPFQDPSDRMYLSWATILAFTVMFSLPFLVHCPLFFHNPYLANLKTGLWHWLLLFPFLGVSHCSAGKVIQHCLFPYIHARELQMGTFLCFSNFFPTFVWTYLQAPSIAHTS